MTGKDRQGEERKGKERKRRGYFNSSVLQFFSKDQDHGRCE